MNHCYCNKLALLLHRGFMGAARSFGSCTVSATGGAVFSESCCKALQYLSTVILRLESAPPFLKCCRAEKNLDPPVELNKGQHRGNSSICKLKGSVCF